MLKNATTHQQSAAKTTPSEHETISPRYNKTSGLAEESTSGLNTYTQQQTQQQNRNETSSKNVHLKHQLFWYPF